MPQESITKGLTGRTEEDARVHLNKLDGQWALVLSLLQGSGALYTSMLLWHAAEERGTVAGYWYTQRDFCA